MRHQHCIFTLLVTAFALGVMPTNAHTANPMTKPKQKRSEPKRETSLVNFTAKALTVSIELEAASPASNPTSEAKLLFQADGAGKLESRFAANGDGTATDIDTKLIWTVRDNGSDINWVDSRQYCTELNLGGHADWRLPTIEELEQLYVEGLSSDCGRWHEYEIMTCHIYPSFELTSCCPWSSTNDGSSSLWNFNFRYGKRYARPVIFSHGRRALCVRRSSGS